MVRRVARPVLGVAYSSRDGACRSSAGTLANPTGFGNPRTQSAYDEPIYRSDEPGVSLHEEHRRTFGRGGMGADDPFQYNQQDADWAGSKYQRGFHSEGPGLGGGGFPPISGPAEPPARSLFADSGNAYSGEGGDRFAPSSYGASDYGVKPSTDYGSSSNYGAGGASSYGDYDYVLEALDGLRRVQQLRHYGASDYGTTTPAAEEKKSTHLYDHAHIETRPTSSNRKTVIIAGSSAGRPGRREATDDPRGRLEEPRQRRESGRG